jgi:hypothetical protein
MMPFEAIEVMGGERREALMADAEGDRSTRPARLRARRRLVSKVSSFVVSIRRPTVRRRPAEWEVPVHRPAQRAT